MKLLKPLQTAFHWVCWFLIGLVLFSALAGLSAGLHLLFYL